MNRKFLLFPSLVVLGAFVGGCTVESYPASAAPQPAPPPAQTEVVVETAPAPPPPPPPDPPPPPPPSPEHVWVQSHYRWDGHRYDMQHGHYERRPRPGARWVEGHWEHRGRGQVWVDERWE